MEPILTRFGYRCDLCLAFRPNVVGRPESREVLSDGWHCYYGFRIPASEICCDGCMTDDPELIYQNCPVRPCVSEKGVDNCSQCDQYACEKLASRLVTFEAVQQRVGTGVSEADYERFIKPYENRRRLDALMRSKSIEE